MNARDSYRTPAIVCDADKLSQVAIIQELGRYGVPVVAVAGSPRAIGLGSQYIRRRVLCPIPSHHAAYIPFLIANVPAGVLFYSNDANAENISRYQEELRSNGFSIPISDRETLERVIEKDRLYETALECGISVPWCCIVSSAAAWEAKLREFEAPAILKSTNLAGGIYRFVPGPESTPAVFREMAELIRSEKFQHRRPRLMVQQWVPPSSTRLWNFNSCVQSGEILSYSMRQRMRTDVRPDGTLGSMLMFGKTEYNPDILERNRRLLRHLNFSGIVETEWSEYKDGTRRFYLYDFNPRPGGNFRWTFKSGASLAEQYYRAAQGLPPMKPLMKTGIVYAKVFYRHNDLVEALTNRRLSFLNKAAVLRDDFVAVLLCGRHAVDVLDPRDLGPTFRAVGEVASIVAGGVARLAHRSMKAWPWQMRRMKYGLR